MRWAYLLRGRNRLIGHDFPKTKFGPDWISFLDAWYTKYDWLEYSVEKDAAYCFYCFLFKSSSNGSHFGHDVVTKMGFKNCNKASENFNHHTITILRFHAYCNRRGHLPRGFRLASMEST
jgi:hypothetical protein